jgi:predicted dehydrogenase
MTVPIRVGVVGTGLIAQVMHLHYLADMTGDFELAAVCDLDEGSAAACARRYGIPAALTEWRDLIELPLDAVLVLTSGSHAPIATAAAAAGRHIFVEKPMCFSAAEGRAMIAAAEQAGVVLMVGYPKRYDPAYLRLADEVSMLSEPRLLRVTTLESPFLPYVGHYRLPPRSPLDEAVLSALRADSDERIAAALPDATDDQRRIYHGVLLDTLVHELNGVRGLLGEPTRLDYVDLAMDHVTAMLRCGELPVAVHWIDLPGMASYEMEFAVFAPERRLRLTFPSPFLRNEPATLEIEDGIAGSARSRRSTETVGYESGFRRELQAFHDCIVTGSQPVTSGADGNRDIALCQALIECFRLGTPIDDPAGSSRHSAGRTVT